MTGLHEGTLIIVGLGTAIFMLAFSRIVTVEAARVLDYHFLYLKAMKLRNRYAESVIALRPQKAPDGAGRADDPTEDITEAEAADEPEARRAA
ncbi:MAG: hypothetical protein IT431_15030 [Phycisphaerales bacterium]|nr:hypothetical protein [Phycisphaerales bacterium]